MTTVGSTTSSPSISPPATRPPAKTIAGNFDTFLKLLTTQLQNQNPLDPLDTNQFTQQLVEFSGVEQALKTNDLLGTLVSASTANRAASAAGYLGATITADGSTTALSGGKARLDLFGRQAGRQGDDDRDRLDRRDRLHQVDRSRRPARRSFTWDGRSDDGSLYTSGKYTLKIDAKDAAGQPVTVSTEIAGTVDAVDLSGDQPVLNIGNISVPLDKVKTLRRSSS